MCCFVFQKRRFNRSTFAQGLAARLETDLTNGVSSDLGNLEVSDLLAVCTGHT